MTASRCRRAGGSAGVRCGGLWHQIPADEIALDCPLEVPGIVPRAGRWLPYVRLDKSAHCSLVEFGNSVEFGRKSSFHPTSSSLKSAKYHNLNWNVNEFDSTWKLVHVKWLQEGVVWQSGPHWLAVVIWFFKSLPTKSHWAAQRTPVPLQTRAVEGPVTTSSNQANRQSEGVVRLVLIFDNFDL